MRLTAISGVGVKGPACFLVEIAGRRLMLDLGRGPDGDALPDLAGVGPVDAILLSHGHVDHTGGLHLARQLGQPPLFAPGPTIALSTDPTLRAATALDGLTAVLGVPVLSGPGGHAPGASWMRIGGAEGLLYSGDLSQESDLWRWTPPPEAAAMVFDASYGVADESLDRQIGGLLARATRPLLLPAPAGGRGLEMALAFLDAGHEVALCPAHRAVAREMANRAAWLVKGGGTLLRRLLDQTGALTAESPARGVMIAAGPNAERGVAGALAPRFLDQGSAAVIFTGHLAGGSPSAGWVATGRAAFHRWNVHPTLTGLRALFAAVRPRQAMAAFCTADAIADLAAALQVPLGREEAMVW